MSDDKNKKIINIQVKSKEINKQNLSLKDFEYDQERPIGKGGFCSVYKAIFKDTKKIYALKVIDKSILKNEEEIKNIINEIEIMNELDSPNLLKLITNFEDENNIYIILPLCQNGQLYDLLHKSKKKVKNIYIKKYLYQTIQAINNLHKKKIIHRDIKPENILIDNDDNALLSDYGIATHCKEGETRNTYCGTDEYLAPEVIRGERYDEKIDIWAIGILTFIYGFTSLINTRGVILTIVGLIILAIFTYYELKQDSPVFNMNLFKNSKFTSSNIAALCSYLAIMVVTTILNYHFQYVRGWDAQMAGLILIITPILMAIIAPNSGKLSDKIHPQKLAAVGIGIAAIALGILTFLNGDTPIYIVILAMILQGIGMGLFSSPNMNAIMSSVPPKDTPVASASVATMRVIGQTMSMGMLTLVFAFVMGDVPIIAQYFPLLTASCQFTCLICMVLCVISVFASLIGIKSKGDTNEV